MSRDDYGLRDPDTGGKKSAQKPARTYIESEKSQKKSSMDSAPMHIWAWRIFKPLLTIAISLAIVGVCLYFTYNKIHNDYFSPVDVNSTEKIEIVIPSGSSLTKISELLKEKGIIRSAKVFKYYVDFSDMSSKIKAGTFVLSPSMTFDDIVDVIKRPNEMSAVVKVILREGLTVEQTADKIMEAGVDINKEEFLRLCKTGADFSENAFIASVLSDERANERKYALEGYLFPDTYEFYTDATEETVINRLLSRFGEIMKQEYSDRAEQLGYTANEILTLASMIEKEAKSDDFAGVSAVFHNRLKDDWTLGSDATVQYFTGSTELVLTDTEIEQDSPYNTYMYKGLPPGAICNPGNDAIKAALFPDEETMKGGYMFFCLGDPETGEIIYSKTLEEHNAAVAAYEELWKAYHEKTKNGNDDGDKATTEN